MKLNEFLRLYRRAKGLSQVDLAEKIRVSMYKLRKWETGEVQPKSIDQEKIRKYFNLKSLVDISHEALQSALGGGKSIPLPEKELLPISTYEINDVPTLFKLLEEKDKRISDLQQSNAVLQRALDALAERIRM